MFGVNILGATILRNNLYDYAIYNKVPCANSNLKEKCERQNKNLEGRPSILIYPVK